MAYIHDHVQVVPHGDADIGDSKRRPFDWEPKSPTTPPGLSLPLGRDQQQSPQKGNAMLCVFRLVSSGLACGFSLCSFRDGRKLKREWSGFGLIEGESRKGTMSDDVSIGTE